MSLFAQGAQSSADQNEDGKYLGKFGRMYKEPSHDPLIESNTFSSLTEEWGDSAQNALALLLKIAEEQRSTVDALRQQGGELSAVQQAEALNAIQETNDLLKDWAAVASRCQLSQKDRKDLEKYLEGPGFPAKDKQNYGNHKKEGENPIQYLFRVWGRNIVHGNLYLFQLRDLDEKLVRAVYNFCNTNSIIPSVFLPPSKSSYASHKTLRIACKDKPSKIDTNTSRKRTKRRTPAGELTP